MTKFRGPLVWDKFAKAVILPFGPTDYEDPSEALTRLRQTSTVAAYQEGFEKLSHRVNGLHETFLIGCFIVGLRDDIRLDVKIKQPRTLSDAIGVTRLIKERNYLQKQTSPPFRSQSALATPKLNPNLTADLLGPSSNPHGTPSSNYQPRGKRSSRKRVVLLL